MDTPGLHKPRSALGERLNEHVGSALSDVDLVIVVLDATARVGPGDRRVLESALDSRAPEEVLVVVNKIDVAPRASVVERLVQASEAAGGSEIFPVSAATGKGVDPLVSAVIAQLPEGPAYFPEGTLSDVAESVWVAEMVREALLAARRRGASPLDRMSRHRMGLASHQGGDPRRTRLAKRDCDRCGWVASEARRHDRAKGPSRRCISRATCERRAALAAPTRCHRTPWVLRPEPRSITPCHPGVVPATFSRNPTTTRRSVVQRIGGSEARRILP